MLLIVLFTMFTFSTMALYQTLFTTYGCICITKVFMANGDSDRWGRH